MADFGYDPTFTAMREALKLAESSGAPKEVTEKIKSAVQLAEQRENFTMQATTSASEACANISDVTVKHDWKAVPGLNFRLSPGMMTGHLEGQFLKCLVSMQGAKRVLDIGMFTGYSALSLAEALPADGEVVTIDVNEYLKDFTGNLLQKSPHYKKIKIMIGRATEIMKDMAKRGEKFDLMFLDAVKSEYIDYFQVAFKENLLAPRGTVLVDNMFMRGDAYIPERKDSPTRKFAEAVMADNSLFTVAVPMRDGVMMIRRKSEVEGAVA